MKKFFYIIILLAMIVLVGCRDNHVTIGDLMINGDCQISGNITDLLAEHEFIQIDYHDESIPAISTATLISLTEPKYEAFDLFLKASDGFMIKLDGSSLSDTYLGYSSQARWAYISEKHPVNSQIKHITELIVVKKEGTPQYDFGVNIVTPTSTTNYSVGELLLQNYQSYLKLDGISSMGSSDEHTEVAVMKQKKLIPVQNLIEEPIDSVLVMTALGDYIYNYRTGYLDIVEGAVNYYVPEDNLLVLDIEGVMINPPSHTVMDTYDDSLYYLEKGQDVLIIFVDGFSYSQYQYLLDHNSDLFIANLPNVVRANTVFKPVTNAGFAAMISGTPPSENGVLDRSYRELLVPTLFDQATNLGLKSALVEGDISILNIATDISLNFDLNGDGFNEDEIYADALTKLAEKNNLLMVHFHSLDDFGHDYGRFNDEIWGRLAVIDEYIQDLAGRWSGKVILVADHGMHSTEDGGSHGEFRHEDLYIPYVIFDGGESIEKH